MKDNMSEMEFISKFKELCKDCDRYTNRTNVKIHNKAIAKLDKMDESVRDNPQLTKKVYYELLHDEDEVVRRVAATHCLHEGIYIDEAIDILEYLSENAELPITRISAGMQLFIRENPPEKFEQNLKENREAFCKEMIEEKERLAKDFLNNPKFNKQ